MQDEPGTGEDRSGRRGPPQSWVRRAHPRKAVAGCQGRSSGFNEWLVAEVTVSGRR